MNPDFQNGRSDKTGLCALLTGGLAGVLASACCLGPLVLITLGASGAWIGNLTALEPYRLGFIAAAGIALFSRGDASGGPPLPVNPDRAVPYLASTAAIRRCSGWSWH